MQRQKAHTSRQADIFSFGKTLYEMCTGLPVKSYPCLPSDIRHWEDHQLLLKLNKIIARASARELRRRYASASDFRADLEQLIDE
jgi:serine/threonine protein kinase